MKTICRILLLLSFIAINKDVRASHLVVGEMTYKHLGNNMYEFTLYYYRDCRKPSQGGGNPAALQSDDPALISIYDGLSFYSFDSVFYSDNTILPDINPNGCENSPDSSCISKLKFKFVKYLPPSGNEYTIINARCCLNESIINIANPGTTGYRFYCKIPPAQVGNNNSAVFAPVSDTRYCVNKKYMIDHSAIDTDGDSLSYGFALPESGGNPNDPKPIFSGGTMPTFSPINYSAPYTVSYPMPGMTINEKTGIISLNATIQGVFVVNVYCNEWRNGILINTIKRTFIYTIRNCNFDVIPVIACDTNVYQATEGNACLSNCESKTIHFKNNSIGAVSYHWNFGVGALQDDTSNVFEPVYTYPDTGRYKVILITYGSSCTDSITQYVNVYNDMLTADFTYTGKLCTGNAIQFNSTATSLNDSIAYWKWDFINSEISYINFEENPDIIFQKAGTYNVNFKAFNRYGCYTDIEKTIDVTTVNVSAYHDTIVPKKTEVNLYATGADSYFWYLPPSALGYVSPDNTPITTIYSNTYAQKAVAYVIGTNTDGCIGMDSVEVIFTNEETIFVPNAFSPNGDNLNDEVKPFLSGYKLKYFKIYNRRGQQVFSTTNLNYGWDGKFGGEPMGIDTYYWVASVENTDKMVKIFKGDITLVR